MKASFIILFGSLFAAVANAQEPSPPRFVLSTLSGPLSPASLVKLDENWTIELDGAKPRVLSAKEWVSLRQDGASLPAYPVKNCVLLTSGERLVFDPGVAVRVDEETLFLRSEFGSEIKVPLAYLSYLCMGVPDGAGEPDLFLERLAKDKRPRDALYLKNGDRLQGRLTLPVRDAKFTVNLGDRSADVPQDQVAVWAMSSEYQAHLKTKKPLAHLVTTNGARLQFSSLRLDRQREILAGKTLYGASLEVPLNQVASLAMRQGQAVYLSDLKPALYEFTPFFGIQWPLGADANCAGRQLALGQDHFDKGLAMHAKSQVTYDLDGKTKWLEAQVGLQDATGPGQAKVSVIVGGKTVFAKDLNRAAPSRPIRVDLSNARSVTLLVDFSNFGDVQARVYWADARLIKDGQ
jgi:hypothetical protein